MIRPDMIYASVHASPAVTSQFLDIWILKATTLLQEIKYKK